DARLVARARHAVSLGLELVFHQKVVNRKAANDKAVMRWHEAGTRQIDVIRVCNLNALHRPRSDFRNRKMMKLPARSVDLAPTALQLSIQPGARHVFHGGELDAIVRRIRLAVTIRVNTIACRLYTQGAQQLDDIISQSGDRCRINRLSPVRRNTPIGVDQPSQEIPTLSGRRSTV